MDGLDQGVVFLGGLGRHTEAVVVEATEVGGVADEDAMVVDEPFLQVLTSMKWVWVFMTITPLMADRRSRRRWASAR